MEIERLYHYLNGISPISDKGWSDFIQIIEPVVLHKNEYLIREDSRTFRCFLLTEGVIRAFYSKEGYDHNTAFFVPGMFPIAYSALLSGGPSRFSYQAALSCKLIQFPYHDFRILCEKHECLETLRQQIFEQLSVLQEKYETERENHNATTNFLIFRKTYPGLENLISKSHIASYLGITPIQLVRIQAILSKQRKS